MILDTPETSVLTQVMDAAAIRHSVLSQNIANVNTPGYKRLDVAFEDALGEHLKRGDLTGLAHLKPRIFEEQNLPARHDGNNVDVDQEVGQLGKNALLYETYTQLMGAHLASMQRAIELR